MDNQIREDTYGILARERSHEDARQTVATNRMLVQSLVIINGGAAIAVLACYSAHNISGSGKSAAPSNDYSLLSWGLYCRFRRSLRQANNSRRSSFMGA